MDESRQLSAVLMDVSRTQSMTIQMLPATMRPSSLGIRHFTRGRRFWVHAYIQVIPTE